MNVLNEILAHNKQFVENKGYESFQSDKFPQKKMVIISCMDTRLVELLPKAMNFGNGDVKIIKTAGAVVSHPFGSVMRSIMIAIYSLGAEEVYVVGHHDCGMAAVSVDDVVEAMKKRDVSPDTMTILENAGIDLNVWLRGFKDVSESVENSVNVIRNHPLIPADVKIHGLVIHPTTGKLDVVVDGNA
ncbi:carbonic anhydrase [Bacillus sp. AGMB 02131]|uniref:carbonic anhydrase n=1 Tax=Peribacillus faecalis TaxID=2772559 RepID=A0A927CY63_9BACI|nr:carbonic anhydrase [Peribacillus faecalis]MBD3109801.1 carbonic anhydrase [Peribacillus faecalis]